MIFGAHSASDILDARSWRDRDDEDLVRTYRRGTGTSAGRAAVAELLDRYRARVFQWCRGYTRDREEALDLAQDVLVNAYRGLDSFEGGSKFSSWLFAVARNRCLSAVRRKRPERDDGDQLDRLPAAGPGADATLEHEQRQRFLRRVMRAHLSRREEEAIWLRAVERMSVDQITATLRLENATGARSLLQNARRKLRRVLGDREDPFGEDDDHV